MPFWIFYEQQSITLLLYLKNSTNALPYTIALITCKRKRVISCNLYQSVIHFIFFSFFHNRKFSSLYKCKKQKHMSQQVIELTTIIIISSKEILQKFRKGILVGLCELTKPSVSERVFFQWQLFLQIKCSRAQSYILNGNTSFCIPPPSTEGFWKGYFSWNNRYFHNVVK